MKIHSKFILTIIIMLLTLVAVALIGCSQIDPNDSVSELELDVGADYITVESASYRDNYWRAIEFKLNDGKWQEGVFDGKKFLTYENLTPNTEYTVYARAKGKSNTPLAKTVTTLKRSVNAPAEITYTQANKDITLAGTDGGMEFSYDNGSTWIDDNTYSFTDNGEKAILVRYKETDSNHASDYYTVNVNISDFYGGRGTEDDPYLVNGLEQFMAVSNLNSHKNYFKLLSDIEFGNEPITRAIRCARFDGNGHRLVNPIIRIEKHDEYTNEQYIGIFSSADLIKDIEVLNANIETEVTSTYAQIGILVAYSGRLINCHVSGSIKIINNIITKFPYVGGIAGRVSTSVKDLGVQSCSADVTIDYPASNSAYGTLVCGGLIGAYERKKSSSDITDNMVIEKSFANITFRLLGTRIAKIGGLLGYGTYTDIINCYSSGSIETASNGYTGYASESHIGGIVGELSIGNIKYCYAAMNIASDGREQNVIIGGISSSLASISTQTLQNCFFVGNIYISKSDKTYSCDSMCAVMTPLYSISDCYHSDNLSSQVGTSKSIAVAEETMITLDWQVDALGLDTDIWILTEGELPTLK